MGVPLQVRKHCDNIAKTVQALQESVASRGRLWTIADAAQDETFENRVNVTALSTADDAIEASAAIFSNADIKKAITLLQDYANTDLGLASPYLDTYFACTGGFRVPYEFAEAYYAAVGGRLLARNVFPKGTLVADEADPANAGMHQFGALTGTAGASTYAAVDGALTTSRVAAAAVVCISRDATPGGPPTLTFVLEDGTTKNIAVTPSATQYGQVLVGSQAITSVTGLVLGCAATAQFKAGNHVLIYENADGDTSIREIAKVKTVTLNTSVEVEFDEASKTAFVNTITTDGYIVPMFTNVSAFVSGNINNSTHLDFYALPDRILAF